MDNINIVLCIDENYAQHAGVTIASILYNKKSNNQIVFHIISDFLSLSTCNKLKEITDKYGSSLLFYTIDSTSFNQLPVAQHISKATYYRLIICDILPLSIKKVLYLDVDLIVRTDINQLWHTDISSYYAAAIQDFGIEITKLRETLGMLPQEPYFNAGVLLINVIKWREESIAINIIKFINANVDKINFADQDGLNAILRGKWVLMHPKWNVYRVAFRKYYKWGKKGELPKDVIQAVKEPCIVHFTGSHKPWHVGCPMPYVNEYYYYLALTPWKKYQRPRPTIHQLLKEYRWKLRIYIVDLLARVSALIDANKKTKK